MSLANKITITLLPFVLSACLTVGPDYSTPEVSIPDNFVEAQEADTQKLDKAWWTTLDDPLLNQFIDEAKTRNFDVRIAVARLDEVISMRERITSAKRPKGTLNGRATSILSNTEFNDEVSYQLDSTSGWELDLWGRLSRAIEAADADQEAAEALLKDVHRSVVAQVTRDYYMIRGAQQERDVAKRNINTQIETAQLTRSLVKVGLRSEADTARANALLSETKARLPLYEATITQGIYNLVLLTDGDARSVREKLNPAVKLPNLPLSENIGIPAELLRDRPDIRMAERELAAATALIGVSTSDLYPRVSLTGDLYTSSNSLNNLFSSDNMSFGVGPSIRWDFLNYKRIRAEIDAQGAKQQQALVRYEQTVTQAITEVEISLATLQQRRLHRSEIVAALQYHEQAMQLVNTRYREGVQSFLDVLAAQRSVLAMETTLAQIDTILIQDFIALNTSLGRDEGITNTSEIK